MLYDGERLDPARSVPCSYAYPAVMADAVAPPEWALTVEHSGIARRRRSQAVVICQADVPLRSSQTVSRALTNLASTEEQSEQRSTVPGPRTYAVAFARGFEMPQ